jgi:hypothetical protein
MSWGIGWRKAAARAAMPYRIVVCDGETGAPLFSVGARLLCVAVSVALEKAPEGAILLLWVRGVLEQSVCLRASVKAGVGK